MVELAIVAAALAAPAFTAFADSDRGDDESHQYEVVSVIPAARISESVDEPAGGVPEVERI